MMQMTAGTGAPTFEQLADAGCGRNDFAVGRG
jgi:hypothetical protein